MQYLRTNMPHSIRQKYLLVGANLFFASLICDNWTIAADPNLTDPKPPIPIHGFMEESKKLFEEASKSDEACTTLYQQMKKGTVKPEPVGKLSMNVSRLRRLANRLIELGEPSGVEFVRRNETHEKERAEAFNALMAQPKIQPTLEKAAAVLKKGVTKRLKKAEEAVATALKDAIAAQNLLDPAYDEYESIAGILPTSMREVFMELPNAFGKIDGAATLQRRKMVDQAVDTATNGFLKELESYYADCSNAHAALQGGKLTWNEKSLTGPEFSDEIMRTGFVMQARMQKVNALQHLHSRNMNQTGGNLIFDDCTKQLSNLREQIQSGIVRLLEKDVQGLATNDLLNKIGQYAVVLGKYAHRTDNDDWIKFFDDALLKATAGSKDAEKIVRNYQTSTNEMLKWKETFASKQETFLTGNFLSLSQVISAATPRTDTQPGYIFVGSSTAKLHPQFYAQTQIVLPLLRDKLGKDAPVIVREVVRLDSDSPIWISRWENYIYGRFPNDFYKTDQASKLKTDLMISEASLPLSVRAASAVYTAERGDGLTIGGVVNEVTAEGALMRIVATKDTGAPFTGITKPVSFETMRAVDQVALRVNTTPKWFRHRYFAVTK